MDIKELLTTLGSSSLALVVFYFYYQYRMDTSARIAKLEAEIVDLRKQHDIDLERLIRRRAGDTRPIPELPPEEIEKARRRMQQ